jgi:hypothetical protein
MSTFASGSKSELFIFLINAPGILALGFEDNFRIHQDKLLEDARKFKKNEGDTAVWLFVSYHNVTGVTGRSKQQCYLENCGNGCPSYTHSCHMAVVNGKVQELFFDNAYGTRERGRPTGFIPTPWSTRGSYQIKQQ